MLPEIGTCITTRQAKDYYSHTIPCKTTPFYSSESSSSPSIPHSHLQNEESNSSVEIGTREPFLKRILVVDDDPDLTLTFKVGLEGYYSRDNDKIRFEVCTYNNPAVAVREFKPNFYDLLLTDINMPYMNGFELCQKILELDINVRVCFISAAEVNVKALREVYSKARSIGCFIKKPVEIEYLVRRLLAELD